MEVAGTACCRTGFGLGVVSFHGEDPFRLRARFEVLVGWRGRRVGQGGVLENPSGLRHGLLYREHSLTVVSASATP